MKKYLSSISSEDYEFYKTAALAELKSDAEVIEKLFETFVIVKNNMLQHS